MELIKKRAKEIIALYSLEQNLKDIYVEGNCDKTFYDNYLQNKKSTIRTKLIDSVDFSDVDPEYIGHLDLKSNRNKAIVLSKLINELVADSNTRCIIDKDFDDYLPSYSNEHLLKTDFCCIESYIFSEEVLNKFISIGVRNFPIPIQKIIQELSAILRILFCYRMLREKLIKSAQMVDIDSNIVIDKKKGEIVFDSEAYFKKFILKNNLSKRYDEIWEEYNNILHSLATDTRNAMQGHDFVHIFYLYITKIKNNQKFKEVTFEVAVFLTPEMSHLEGFKLFKYLNDNYN